MKWSSCLRTTVFINLCSMHLFASSWRLFFSATSAGQQRFIFRPLFFRKRFLQIQCHFPAPDRNCTIRCQELQDLHDTDQVSLYKTIKYYPYNIRGAEIMSRRRQSLYHLIMLKFTASLLWLLTISRWLSFALGASVSFVACFNQARISSSFSMVSTRCFFGRFLVQKWPNRPVFWTR